MLKSFAVAAAAGTASLLGKVGVTLDGDTVAALVVVYVGIETGAAALLWKKVTPVAKLERVLAPEQHASVMASLRIKKS